jgi:hypothetical protein
VGEFSKVYFGFGSGRAPLIAQFESSSSTVITFGPGSAKSQILGRSSAGSSGKSVNSCKPLFCCCCIVLRTNIEVGCERRLLNEVEYEAY